jgi:hypothetical protein
MKPQPRALESELETIEESGSEALIKSEAAES